MNAPSISAVPIWLPISLQSSPPLAPVDSRTGTTPQIYRGGSVALLMGFFDQSGNAVDISNLTGIQVTIQPSQSSPYAVVNKVIPKASFQSSLITPQGWTDGIQWNVECDLGAADTDQGLSGGTSQQYWLTVQGLLGSGGPVIYMAGPVTIVNPGSSLPSPLVNIVSRNSQAIASGDITVQPLSQLHTERITLSGTARTQNCLLSSLNVLDGARLTIMWTLPTTLGISYACKSVVPTNPVLGPGAVATSSYILSSRTVFFYDANQSTWVAEKFDFPAP